ncbi:MAG TPA: hypothetical protein V6C97_28740 [Oculatellaceae cyanobacterium]
MNRRSPHNLIQIAIAATFTAVLIGLLWGTYRYVSRHYIIEVHWANDPALKDLQ